MKRTTAAALMLSLVGAANADPVLWICENATQTVYLLSNGASVAMFAANGKSVGQGTLANAKTDKGVDFLYADVGSIGVGLYKRPDNLLEMFLVTTKDAAPVELTCR